MKEEKPLDLSFWQEINLLKLPDPSQAIFTEDGNAVSNTLREISATFREISQLASLPLQSIVVLSTDMYKSESMKGVEKIRQGVSNKLDLGETKRLNDWKQFLPMMTTRCNL